MDDAWVTPDVANLLFEDKLSLRQTLAKRMINQVSLGGMSRAEICADGVTYMRARYALRWRN
jgi:hypothetical protein